MNKATFMNELRNSLSEYGVNDSREILLDFEQHFEDGKAAGETEDQVCEKLGNPVEIAKQYISGSDIKVEEKEVKQSAFDSNTYSQPYTQQPVYQSAPAAAEAEPKKFKPDAAKIIGVLCVDLLVFSWVIPALMSLIIGLYSCTLGLGLGGIAVFIGGVLLAFINTITWLFTSFSPLSTALFGIVMMALSSLLVFASIGATKGFINIFKHIVNWHSEAFVGKKICKTGKKTAKEAA